MNASGGAQRLLKMIDFFASKGLNCRGLDTRIKEPIRFLTPITGIVAHGYEATGLADMCDLILDARKEKILGTRRMHMADCCELLVRSFARVGIIALIDEATGHQYDRPRRDLEEHLKRFVSEGLRRWVQTFPSDYFKHLCRLQNVVLRPDMRLPQYFGHLTNDWIYRRLAPGLLRRLKEKRAELGKPGNKLHSWLSQDTGYPEVILHLGKVVGLMMLSDNYDAFRAELNKIAPLYPEIPGLFDDPKEWE